jgi:hypothetical protein
MHVSCVTALRSHGTLLHAPGAAGLWLNARRLGAPLPFHADPAGPHRSSASCSSTVGLGEWNTGGNFLGGALTEDSKVAASGGGEAATLLPPSFT